MLQKKKVRKVEVIHRSSCQFIVWLYFLAPDAIFLIFILLSFFIVSLFLFISLSLSLSLSLYLLFFFSLSLSLSLSSLLILCFPSLMFLFSFPPIIIFEGWKALHIAVFETFSEKGNPNGVRDESAESVKNADGTVRGNLMAVCPLYVKYNR